MNKSYLFVFLAFVSGLIGLSYEVIYQRIFLSIGGDLFGTYVMVVATFILGMATGNLAGVRLRSYLALIEGLNGLFAIGTALFLIIVGYLVSIPQPVICLLIALPAFAVGTSIPLYSYYFRQVRFSFIYAIYNLGAVASIFAIEFYFISFMPLSHLLLSIGICHLIIGCLVFLFYQRGLFRVESKASPDWRTALDQNSTALIGLFVFSFISFYYHFWALKVIYYLLLPLRMISSLAIAASLFWIFVGVILDHRLKSERKQSFYMLAFAAHVFLVVFASDHSGFLIPYLFVLDNYSGIFFLIFLMLSPCLWASSYLIGAVKTASAGKTENIDLFSGLFLFISSLGNAAGFALAVLYAPYLTSSLYLAPLSCLLLTTPVTKNKKPIYQMATCLFLLGIFFITPYDSLLKGSLERKEILYRNRPSIDPDQFWSSLDARANDFQRSIILKKPRIYASAGATVTMAELSFPDQTSDISFILDGTISHSLYDNGYRTGFIPRLYFPNAIPSSLVIGLGAGRTAAATAMVSERTDLVEISALILRVMDDLTEFNANVLHAPGAQVYKEDGLNFLKDTDQKYNAIINIASSHYSVWAAKLYSLEMLHLIKQHLTEDGVYETWLAEGVLSDYRQCNAYINMLKKSFAHVDLHVLEKSKVMLVAYDKPRDLTPFDFSMLSPWAQTYLQEHPLQFPSAKEINTKFVRDVPGDPSIPAFEPTLDHPELEILTTQHMLSNHKMREMGPNGFWTRLRSEHFPDQSPRILP